jgi:hypothetical protein
MKLEEEYGKLYEENKELTKKYIALLEENKKCNELTKLELKTLLDVQEDIDTYCDFNMLITQMKKQDKKYNDMKELLEKCLNYIENGCSDEDKWVLGQDIKKVLESKNEKI